MDVDEEKPHKWQSDKWHGSKEKKWEWYKHTKPCNNILNSGICQTVNCNYAHTLEQYIEAITKRNFSLDPTIVTKLRSVTCSKKRSYEEYESNDTKRQRQDY